LLGKNNLKPKITIELDDIQIYYLQEKKEISLLKKP
jgi:hypothetical protein